jgi:tRNA-dihydrouridine synthase A
MDWTDRYCRYFHRLMTRHALLYTEMVTSGAVVFGDRERLIGFDEAEHPVALQLGGSKPSELAEAARIAEGFGYDEINLNVGCPSDRVKSGNFGAWLMLDPPLVGQCVEAMNKAVNLPVTVKCRIGVDDQDEDEDLDRFIETVADAGCTTFIVHARKAWLKGLSPKQNRDVPPLNYERVYQLKKNRPQLEIHINGGIENLDTAIKHLEHVDAVMLGRAAYHEPFLLAKVDEAFYGQPGEFDDRVKVVEAMFDFIAQELEKGTRLPQITRHMLGLFHARPGARLWRRYLAEHAHLPGADVDVLRQALDFVRT